VELTFIARRKSVSSSRTVGKDEKSSGLVLWSATRRTMIEAPSEAARNRSTMMPGRGTMSSARTKRTPRAVQASV
jgi:hypothetical protein